MYDNRPEFIYTKKPKDKEFKTHKFLDYLLLKILLMQNQLGNYHKAF